MTKFDQGAHSVSTAQVAFFHAVQSADCEAQFFDRAYDFARGATPGIDLRGTCTPRRLTNRQFVIRQDLMHAITLYADALQALATRDDDKNLAGNARDLAGKLNGLAKSGGLAMSGIGAGVEAAIIGLTDMAMDNVKFGDIRTAAQRQQDNLARVVAALKQENLLLAAGIEDNLGTMRAELVTTLVSLRKAQGRGVLFPVLQARGVLQLADPFGTGPIAASPGALSPNSVPASVAAQLNTALDGLVVANQAVATAGTGGITAAVSDLAARAQQAQADQAALNK